MSGGRSLDVAGQEVRWELSRVDEGSQGQGGGGEVLMLSPGVQPLLDRRRNKTEDSRRFRWRWCLVEREGGRR